MKLKRSTSCGLAEFRFGLRWDRTPVAGLQDEPTALVHLAIICDLLLVGEQASNS
jgi:hypothetical protein